MPYKPGTNPYKPKAKKKGYTQTHQEPVYTESDQRVDQWRMSGMSDAQKQTYTQNKLSSLNAQAQRKGYEGVKIPTASETTKLVRETTQKINNQATTKVAPPAPAPAPKPKKVTPPKWSVHGEKVKKQTKTSTKPKPKSKKKGGFWESITGSGWKQGGAKNYADYEETMDYAEGGVIADPSKPVKAVGASQAPINQKLPKLGTGVKSMGPTIGGLTPKTYGRTVQGFACGGSVKGHGKKK